MARFRFAPYVVTAIVGSVAFGAQVSAKTTITVMAWTLTAYDLNAYRAMCDAFEKQEPSIKVRFISMNTGGEAPYLERVLTMATGNVAPDVIRTPFLHLPGLAEYGIVADLKPLVATDKSMNLADWTASGIASSSWKGRLYGLPHLQSNWWINYNPSVFQQAGVVDPETQYANGTWDFDSMIAAAQKTTKVGADGKTQRWGLMQPTGLNTGILPWIRGTGGRIFSDDGKKCLLGENGAIDGVSIVDSLISTKKVLPLAFDLIGGAKQSRFAMVPGWSDVISLFTAAKVSWKPNQVPFPVGPKSKMTIVSQSHSMTISKQSKHKQEAYKFLKFACGKAGSLKMAEAYQCFVPQKEAQKEINQRLIADGVTGLRFSSEASERTVPLERSLRYQTVVPLIQAQLDRIFARRVTVADGMAQAAKSADADLARVKK